MEHEGKSVSMRGLPNGYWFRNAATGHKIGLSALRSNFTSHLRDFDEDGRLAIMNDRSSVGVDEVSFLPLESTGSELFEKPDAKGNGRHHPVDVDNQGSSLPPVVVAEPEAFALVLVGVGVLGLLLYRRNLA
jgi:hypothetical protein